MGSSKGPSLPTPPSYVENKNLSPNIDFGSDFTKNLLSGDFTGDLAWLNPTVNNNNSALALAAAQGTLQPQFRDTLTQISNQAAANGQLNSSTFTDALARSQSDLNSQYQSIVSQQAIRDAEQSNSNRLNLLGQGLNGLQGFTSLAQGQTNTENDFNLQNYNNQVAAAIAGKGTGSNMFGSLGTALGAGAGFLIGGPMGAGIGATIGGGIGGSIDSSQGGTGSAGFAGMGGGLGLLGSTLRSPVQGSQLGFSAPSANAFASNNPFGTSDFQSGYASSAWNPTKVQRYF